MKVSFIGGGKKLDAACRIFENKKGFELSGVYCKPIEACADTAIRTNMKIYRNTDSLYDESDVIVMAVKDSTIPGIISSLTRFHAHGKVFVTTSFSLTYADLTIAYPNACAIINSPIAPEDMDEASVSSASFVCELFGKNYMNFYNCMAESGIRCKFVSSKQLQLYRTGIHLARYATEAALRSAMQLIRESTVSNNPNHLSPIIKNALRHAFVENTNPQNSPYACANPEEIRKHIDILSENGIDSIKYVYESAARYLTEKQCNDYEAADEVFRILKNHF